MVIDVDLNNFVINDKGKSLQFINNQQNQVDNNVNQNLVKDMNTIFNNSFGIDYSSFINKNRDSFIISKECFVSYIQQELIKKGLPVVNVEWVENKDNYEGSLNIIINNDYLYNDYKDLINNGFAGAF